MNARVVVGALGSKMPTEVVIPPLLITTGTPGSLEEFSKDFAHLLRTTCFSNEEREYFATKEGQQTLFIFWLTGINRGMDKCLR
jgi:hypothetical protein